MVRLVPCNGDKTLLDKGYVLVVDMIFWSHVFDEFQIIGCVLIGIGFVLIALPEKWSQCSRKKKSQQTGLNLVDSSQRIQTAVSN